MEFIIKIPKIISENTYLAPGNKKTKYGKTHLYLYKKPEIAKYQSDIIWSLRDGNYKELVDTNIDLFKSEYFKISWKFIKNRSFNTSDLTNMKKLAEDAFVTFINEDCNIKEFDDSKIIKDTSTKVYDPSSSTEVIIINIENTTIGEV